MSGLSGLAVVGSLIHYWIGFTEYRRVQNAVNTAVGAILNSRCEPKYIPNYVERQGQEQQLKVMLNEIMSAGVQFLPTLVVCGPRGCGKSTLVSTVCRNIPSVVCVRYLGSTEDDFANSLLSSVNVECKKGMLPLVFMNAVLSEIKSRGHRKPVIIIEVDKRFGGEQLENLLLLCKYLGDDKQWIIPIIVLSSTRAAFSMDIGATDLRAEFLEVDDLSEEETRRFLSSVLENVEGADDKKKEVICEAISKIGHRLVHLQSIAKSQLKSLDNASSLIQKQEDKYIRLYYRAFCVLSEKYPSLRNPDILNKIINGQLTLGELADKLRTKEIDLVRQNGSIEPHVLYMSPGTEKVSIGSHFLKKAPLWTKK